MAESYMKHVFQISYEKLKVSNDQEKAQSEIYSHSKNRGGKNK